MQALCLPILITSGSHIAGTPQSATGRDGLRAFDVLAINGMGRSAGSRTGPEGQWSPRLGLGGGERGIDRKYCEKLKGENSRSWGCS